MKIHEYQAKGILKRYNIPVPLGYDLDDLSEVENIYAKINQKTVVIKAQIHAGGRGKGGGVKIAHSAQEVKECASDIMGMQLVTHQTDAQGQKVRRLLIEEGSDIQKEYYIGITLDRSKSMPVMIVSTEGGMSIEEVAAKDPSKIIKVHIDPNFGLQAWQASFLAYALCLEADLIKPAKKIFMALWKVYDQEDCSLIEINPLVTTKDRKIIALDGKINFDDNALYRHSEIATLRDIYEEDELEVEAHKYNLNYIRLHGNVGCMVNGAGLAMATMDIIQYAGAFPANFLDVGGSANVETVTNGFKIILSDKNVKAIFVNIFGGIVRCDRIANGIIEAARNVKIEVPLVVRLAGTNAEMATKILQKSGLDINVASSIQEGSEKIVSLL